MNSIVKNSVEICLSIPTAFPDLNKINQKPLQFLSTSIVMAHLESGHLCRMESLPEAQQMPFLMQELTGLSQNDLDELDIDDSAELTKVIIHFLKKFV